MGEQLVKNYCSGLDDDGDDSSTTILLCPYGAGVSYINHNQTLANVRVGWPHNGTLMHDWRWLGTSPSEWNTNEDGDEPRLVLEYIATRDIQPGDELFLDYGNAWEQAWQEHVEGWNPPMEFHTYVSAHTMNNAATSVLLTEQEAKDHPYPSTLELRCHGGLLHRHHSEYKTLQWERQELGQDPEYGHPCFITQRRSLENSNSSNHHQITYDVIMSVVEDWVSGKTSEVELHRVPRNTLCWFDLPHTTDIHLRMAF